MTWTVFCGSRQQFWSRLHWRGEERISLSEGSNKSERYSLHEHVCFQTIRHNYQEEFTSYCTLSSSSSSWSVITGVSLHLTSKQQKSYTLHTLTAVSCVQAVSCSGRRMQWRPGAGGGSQARVAPPRAPPVSCVLLRPHTGVGAGLHASNNGTLGPGHK